MITLSQIKSFNNKRMTYVNHQLLVFSESTKLTFCWYILLYGPKIGAITPAKNLKRFVLE